MRMPPVRVLAALVVLALLGVATAGCGGGSDSLTLEEYFTRVDQADTDFQEESDALDERASTLEPANVGEARDLLDELLDIFEGFIDDLDGIEPPDDVKEAHDDAVEGLRSAVAAFRDALDESGDDASVDEFFSNLDPAAFDDATRGCLRLEEIASQHDISLDLDCGEE
jgi:hypothetical protein